MTAAIYSYLSDLIDRVAEGLAEELAVYDWRVLPYLDVLSGGKYVCVWDQGGNYTGDQTEEWNNKTQRIGLLLVAGIAASGFDGDMDRLLTDITPIFELAIMKAILKMFVTATAGHEEPPAYRANVPILSPDTGRQGIEHANVSGRVIAKTFVLEVPVRIPTETI